MKLDIVDARFSYPSSEKEILKGVSFSYDSPQVLSILGANGSGKSTLLKSIMREHKLTSGHILVDDKPLEKVNPKELSLKIAYIGQMHTPSFGYRCIDIVLMGRNAHLEFMHMPGKSEYDIAYERMEFLGIEWLAEKAYTEISGGERQLVMLAAALAQDPDTLILDEPTNHLDYGNQFRFLQTVAQLRDAGKGVIMTTHYPDHPILLDSETLILKDGVVKAKGPARELIVRKNLEDLYGIPISVEEISGREIVIPGGVETTRL